MSYTWSRTRASFDNNAASNAGNNNLGTTASTSIRTVRSTSADRRVQIARTGDHVELLDVRLVKDGGIVR